MIYVSVVPKFAREPDLAKQFLLDLCANYDQAIWASKLYNTPSFFQTKIPAGDRGYPPLAGAATLRDLFDAWFAKDPFALPGEAAGKSKPLQGAEQWSTNVGHPGPASPAIGEIFGTFVIPNMFAKVAQGRQERRGRGEGGGGRVPQDLRQVAGAGTGRRQRIGAWPRYDFRG